MSDSENKSLDLLGIKPFGDAINTVAKGGVAGAGAFLGRICLPAAEELGLLLKDKVGAWRSKNILKILAKAEDIVGTDSELPQMHGHPKLISLAINEGSWSDSEEVQEMWAGLLASSCTRDGNDDSNLMFINILKQLTTSQARIVNHICDTSQKKVDTAGWIMANMRSFSLEELKEFSGVQDIHRLDRELDHLRAIGLICNNSGFSSGSSHSILTPTSIALNMYVRCQGSLQSPSEFFELSLED